MMTKVKGDTGRLLVSVVRRGRGDYVAALARQAGAGGGTIVFGRGTGTNAILNILGFTDTAKELVFCVGSSAEIVSISTALKTAPDLCRKAPGIAFTIAVTSFLRASCPSPAITPPRNGDATVEKTANELICAIVNAGLADDIMQTARNAGASGGTILKARGTATGADSCFFGITIVPEKEFLMILATRGQADAIVAAISASECFAEPGGGVLFRMPVEDFFQLGARANT